MVVSAAHAKNMYLVFSESESKSEILDLKALERRQRQRHPHRCPIAYFWNEGAS